MSQRKPVSSITIALITTALAFLLAPGVLGLPGGLPPLLISAAAAQSPSEPDQTRLITLDFRETDIRDVLRSISVQQGINVVPDPDVQGPVTIRLTQVPADVGLRLLANSYGWILEKEDGIYRLRANPAASNLDVEVRGDLLYIEANGTPLARALVALAAAAGRSILPDASLTGAVYARLEGVTFERAVAALLEGTPYTARDENGVLIVEPAEPSPADRAPVTASGGRVSIDADSIGVDVLAREVARLTGTSVVYLPVSPGAPAPSLSIHVVDLSPAEALELIAASAGVPFSVEGGVYVLGRAPAPPVPAGPAQEVAGAGGGVPFTIERRGDVLVISAARAPARALLYEAARAAGVGLVIDRDVDGEITVHVQDVPLRAALPLLARSARLASLEVEPGTWWVGPPERLKLVAEAQPADGAEPLQLPAAISLLRVDDGRLWLTSRGATLTEAFAAIAEATGLSLVVDPAVSGSLQAHVEGLPVEQALRELAAAHGLLLVQEGQLTRILSSPPPAASDPAAGTVEYADGALTLDVTAVAVRDLVQRIARATGVVAFVDPEVPAMDVTLYAQSLSPDEAWAMLAAATGLDVAREEGRYVVRLAVERPERPLPEGLHQLSILNGNLYAELSRVRLGTLLSEVSFRYAGDKDLPAVAANSSVADTLISGSVAGLPYVQGLAALLRPYRLEPKEVGAGYEIVPVETPPPYTVNYSDGRLQVRATDALLYEVLAEIAEKTGVTLQFGPDTDQSITANVQPLPPGEAVAALLAPLGLRLEHPDGTVADPSSWTGPYRVNRVPAPPKFTVTVRDGRIDLEARDAPLVDVLNELGRLTGENFVFASSSRSVNVSTSLRGLPVDTLLEALLAPVGQVAVDTGSYYRVEPIPSPVVEVEAAVEPPTVEEPAQGAEEEPAPEMVRRPPPPGFSVFERDEDELRFEFVGARLADLLDVVNEAAGLRFTVEPDYAETPMTGAIAGPIDSAGRQLRTLLQANNFLVFELPDRSVVRSPAASEPFVHMDENGLFYIETSGADVPSLIRRMANMAGHDVVIYSYVQGNTGRMQVRGLPFEQALELVLQGTRLAYLKSGDTYFVGDGTRPRADSPGLATAKLVTLQHLRAEEFANLIPHTVAPDNIHIIPGQNALVLMGSNELVAALEVFVRTVDVPENALVHEVIRLRHILAADAKASLPPGIDPGRILVLESENALVVSGNKPYIESVRSYLAQIDRRTPQILFEVTMLELTDRASSKLGISAATAGGEIKFDLLSSSPFTIAIGSGFDPSNLSATLSALVQDGAAKVLANPRLATLNGKEASFNVVTTQRFWDPRTEVEEDEDEDGSNTTVVPAFRTVETGIKLRLKPWVSGAGEITLELHPEISETSGSSSGSNLPSTHERSLQTTVRVRDGETIVIGGLIQHSDSNDVVKVPILGDLPIFGRLFQSVSKSESSTEFVIAITSHLEEFESVLE